VLLVLLFVALLILATGAGTYRRWGSTYPAWGGDVLWLLAAALVVAILVSALLRL
jgi:hypothetical protein